MPTELWRAATELAREFGAYRVARAAGGGYQSLKDRLGESADDGTRRAEAFVEIDTRSLFAPVTARGEVELSDASGMKVVVRLGVGESLDVAALLAAFRRTAA